MIYFVRHGLDDEKYIGGYSQAGLIDEGIQQMNVTAAWLLKNVSNINSIYSSDINRAIQSANIINGYLKKEVFIISDLRELNKGVLNGCLKEIAKVKYPEYMDVTDIDFRYPDGESLVDLYNRIKIFLNDIDNYDNCILVTHRGVINMIYTLLNNEELTMNKEKYNVTHASVHEMDLVKRKIRRVK